MWVRDVVYPTSTIKIMVQKRTSRSLERGWTFFLPLMMACLGLDLVLGNAGGFAEGDGKEQGANDAGKNEDVSDSFHG